MAVSDTKTLKTSLCNWSRGHKMYQLCFSKKKVFNMLKIHVLSFNTAFFLFFSLYIFTIKSRPNKKRLHKVRLLSRLRLHFMKRKKILKKSFFCTIYFIFDSEPRSKFVIWKIPLNLVQWKEDIQMYMWK